MTLDALFTPHLMYKKTQKKLAALFTLCSVLCFIASTADAKSHKAKSYSVKGKTYTTRTQEGSQGYSREGVASYYHHKFNGRRTASGEVYNSAKLTAAHKTLPLGSYALVTNLRNKQQVVVRINDRGPFSHSRIIDLSYAAANKIGIIRAGLGQVRVESLVGKSLPKALQQDGMQVNVSTQRRSTAVKTNSQQKQWVKATIATPEQIAELKAQKAAEKAKALQNNAQ